MRLFSAILSALSAEGLDGFRICYTVVDGKGGYFQNVRRIVEFSEAKVVLAGRRGRVCAEGVGLSLGRCGEGDVVVLGQIEKICREES